MTPLRNDRLSSALGCTVHCAALFCLLSLGAIVIHIFAKGFAALTFDALRCMIPPLLGSALIMLLSLLISVPIGVGSAILLTQYDVPPVVRRAVRIASDSLAALPSVVYGMFGMICFVISAGLGFSLLAGALTMSLIQLPLIFGAACNAMRELPDDLRLGGAALGAGRVRVIFGILLPAAARGITAGIILAAGRAAGETAALICTFGSSGNVPDSLFASGSTLAVYMYTLAVESENVGQSYATAALLLILTAAFNCIAAQLSRRCAQ